MLVNFAKSSIAALIANNGGDGISLREAILAANATLVVATPTGVRSFGEMVARRSVKKLVH